MPVTDPKIVKNRVHIDLTSGAADRDQEIDRLLALGEDLPAERLRPEPGQAGQIVSVDDDVVESDGHVASMRGMTDCLSRTHTLLPLVAACPSRTFVDLLPAVLADVWRGAGLNRQDLRVRPRLLVDLPGGQGVARRPEPVGERGAHRRGWGEDTGAVGQAVTVQRKA